MAQHIDVTLWSVMTEGFAHDLPDWPIDLFLLLVRGIVGAAFLVSARNGLKDMQKFATRNSIPVPLGYFLAAAELCGGLGILLGALAPLAGAGLMLLMLGTTGWNIFKWHTPYWADQDGWEYDLMLFTLSGVIMLSGAGALSIDALLDL